MMGRSNWIAAFGMTYIMLCALNGAIITGGIAMSIFWLVKRRGLSRWLIMIGFILLLVGAIGGTLSLLGFTLTGDEAMGNRDAVELATFGSLELFYVIRTCGIAALVVGIWQLIRAVPSEFNENE